MPWDQLGRFIAICTLCGILWKCFSTLFYQVRDVLRFFLRLEASLIRIEKTLNQLANLSRGMQAVMELQDKLAEPDRPRGAD